MTNPAETVQPIVHEIWKDKYSYDNEKTIDETFARLAKAVSEKDPKNSFHDEVLSALVSRRMVPAGRIMSGAGTKKRVTLINCFVSDDIQDSMDTERDKPGLGIMDALKQAALTQQMGGGIGMDFTPLRPRGAEVLRTFSESSGVLHFMDMWHSMCSTIMSSGSRRGAMMATLAIHHPDIREFIKAKRTPGRLTNFNVSVLVTDVFMECLEKDLDWDLFFTVPRRDRKHVDTYERDGQTRYVYERIKARVLWDEIIRNTYEHAEPGIIFVDRINYWNNLHYCEYIHCTNPCGEQPLPANGDCNLGHINLAVMVTDPFTPEASFDYAALRWTAGVLVRFLDNVLDVSLFPTPSQKEEAQAKRRTGIGFTGLANALQMLGVKYGSAKAIEITSEITKEMTCAAYRASINLAKERGSFPAFRKEQYLQGNFIKKLPEDIVEGIAAYGIRNAVLMTIAPTGTTSVTAGNTSSGIEPVFSLEGTRRVLQADGSFKTFELYDYGYLKYHEVKGLPLDGGNALPDYITCTADTLTVDEHVAVMAACQEWIDSSISKTINCPQDMTFESFQKVYSRAYELGLKGCTTYRPNPESGRGTVLAKKTAVKAPVDKVPMKDTLEGRRYRVKWPTTDQAFYIVINDYKDEAGQRRPFEMFIISKSAQHEEWTKAITLLITAIFRRGGDVTFIIEELKQVRSALGGMWHEGSYINSLVAAIGFKIEEHFKWLGLIPDDVTIEAPEAEPTEKSKALDKVLGMLCSSCNTPAVISNSGCKTCMNCGKSDCS